MRVLVSQALDGWVAASLPGLRAGMYGTTPQGTPYVRIVRLALVQ